MKRFIILFLVFFINFLNADSIDSTKTSSDDFKNQVIDNALKSTDPMEDSTYDILRKVFPNSYIEHTFVGFIHTLEEALLKIDIRKIALNFYNTTLNVDDVYQSNEINQFSGDNTMVADFVADLALEYNFENARLTNTLYTEYGIIILSRKNQSTTKSESADTIVLNSGYTRKMFLFENGFLGPFVDSEYQTEFTKKANGSRDQYLRYKTGMRFLDGKYIDGAYVAGVGEIDLSNPPSSIKGAFETGIRAKTPITDDIKLVYQGFYRQYIGYSRYKPQDLIYNINVNVRLDVSIYKGFAFSPFVSARFAKIRGSKNNGSNITTGIALLYSSSINAISSIQSTQDDMLKEYYKSIND